MILTSLRVFFSKMSTKVASSLAPVGVRGMKVLDREKFLCNINVPILKVSDENLSNITKLCKPFFLKPENFKPVQNLDGTEEQFKKCIYLNPEKISSWMDIEESVRTALMTEKVTETNFSEREITLTYDNWKYETIFKAVLPENEAIVSSFSQIGHIIHLNLRDHLLDYRSLIGQVLLDKIKTCHTVVNKSNNIDNTYRNFSMEVIAGEENFLVTVKENSCIFKFDFSKVYWNPRLCKEHERILSYLNQDDILFDVFCGVGPFAVPAAKRKYKVFANDLNPESFKWLNYNAKQNKVKTNLFNSYNQDGKDFICGVFKEYIIEICKGKEKIKENAKIHVTMNLPAIAVEFLKYFQELIPSELIGELKNEIIIYVYCFAIGEDPANVANKMVIENIGRDISEDILDIFNVRNVAPNKEMMRVKFRLSKDILVQSEKDLESYDPPSKRKCVEN